MDVKSLPDNRGLVRAIATVCVALLVAACLGAAMFAPDSAYAAGKKYYAVTKATTTYAGGDYKETVTYQYNKNGLVKKELRSYSDGDASSRAYAYGKNGNVKSAIVKRDGKTIETHTFKADKKGHITRDVCKDKVFGGTLTNTYKYNKKGQLVTAIGQGTWGEYTFKYGEGGRVASSKRTSPEFAGTIATTYAYDAKGTLKSETVVSDGEEGVTVHKNTYKHGRLVKTRAFEDGKLLVTTTYSYKQVKASKSAIKLAKAQQEQIVSQLPIASIELAHK